MRKRTKSIPVNHFGNEFDSGISIEKISVQNIPDFDGEEQSHRHDRHSFFLMEKGEVSIEIDFQNYEIKPLSVIYMHPDQVHRIVAFQNVTVSSCAISNENLNPEYLKLLESITPAKPLLLTKETFAIISEAVSLCLKLAERNHEKLYHSLLKDSCNVLVGLVVSQYLQQSGSADKLSRAEIVTRTFKELLESNFTVVKSPAEFAGKLIISAPYLNECVKSTTGHAVSYHIRQRVVLEAKRLLYYSDKSIKEIATELGYEDTAYFSRMFTKVTGISAIAFRNKNHK